MSRRPVHLTAGAHLSARDEIWAEIRRRKRFTVADIEAATSITGATIRTYVCGLTRAGFIKHDGKTTARGVTHVANQFASPRYRLVQDTGVDAPRVRKNGEIVTQGLAREQMWRTMRVLREFDARELAIVASTETVLVDRDDARKYCYALRVAGYLLAVAPGGRPERYRLVRNTGPKAPMLQRVRQVFDPNLRRVVWPKDVA